MGKRFLRENRSYLAKRSFAVTYPDFEARWKNSGGAKRANYGLFRHALCALIGVPAPDPTTDNPTEDAYVLERAVTFLDGATGPTPKPAPDESTSTNAAVLCWKLSKDGPSLRRTRPTSRKKLTWLNWACRPKNGEKSRPARYAKVGADDAPPPPAGPWLRPRSAAQ